MRRATCIFRTQIHNYKLIEFCWTEELFRLIINLFSQSAGTGYRQQNYLEFDFFWQLTGPGINPFAVDENHKTHMIDDQGDLTQVVYTPTVRLDGIPYKS